MNLRQTSCRFKGRDFHSLAGFDEASGHFVEPHAARNKGWPPADTSVKLKHSVQQPQKLNSSHNLSLEADPSPFRPQMKLKPQTTPSFQLCETQRTQLGNTLTPDPQKL